MMAVRIWDEFGEGGRCYNLCVRAHARVCEMTSNAIST
jgi:hypothetical protein